MSQNYADVIQKVRERMFVNIFRHNEIREKSHASINENAQYYDEHALS